MSLEKIKELYLNSCSILILSKPKDIRVGLDFQLQNLVEDFYGFQLVPKGFHILYWESIKNDSPRFFLILELKQCENLILSWDNKEETFVDLNIFDYEQAERYQNGIKRMDFIKKLTAYPQDLLEKWNSLTSFLNKINKEEKKIKEIKEKEKEKEKEKKNKRKSKLIQLDSDQKNQTINWTTVVPLKIPESAKSLKLRTLHGMDRSYTLGWNLKHQFLESNKHFFAEFQLSFLLFWIVHSVKALEQWKSIIVLLTNCEKALQTEKLFYQNFIKIFINQISYLPSDFFQDELSQGNFLIHCLKSFLEIISQEQNWLNETTMITKLLKKKFKLNFNFNQIDEIDENDEYSPVIVQLESLNL
ncbi:a1 cistron splicing factor aar2-related [Anaeramoeba flamelloides]|uniref:A1 cistron splicing factor aar2-related n=1 Tax=Anaeramoeba flamelloides TaxID=1746091 RepID=A0ABQ8XJT0_9EUKA|nr:a1 cistron splicing factor aar2-related [Anaeramoeba flamelloides]